MATFEELDAKIQTFPGGFTGGGGVSEAEIDNLGAELGFKIRGTFRQFLKKFGWIDIAYSEIFGLGEGVPDHLELKGMTLSERSQMHPSLAPNLLPFFNDGGGNLYCLDLAGSDVEPPVVLWLHDLSAEQAPEPASVSFASWLADELAEREDDFR